MSFFSSTILFSGLAFFIGYAILFFVSKFYKKWGLLDRPHLYKTESGRKPAPYGIGIAITITLLVMMPCISIFFDISDTLEKKLLIITIITSILAVISGLDDLDTIGKSPFSVPPGLRLMMQIGVGLIIGITSIKISYISNFFGGVIRLDEYFFQFEAIGRLYTIYYIPLILTMAWYVVVFNSVNFSDGVPGLTGGFALVSFSILGGLALKLYLTDTTLSSQENSQFILIILAILIPVTLLVTRMDIARMGIMGDSGTIMLAFMIATLAIIAGGKIATAMSVLGIYLIDFVYVVMVRMMKGGNPMKGDQTHHLHYRLLQIGLTQRQIRNTIFILTLCFGIAAIFLDTTGKVILFIFITFVSLFLTEILAKVRKK